MNGNELLEKLGRLSEITCMKDVKPLTDALFPGAHCPLMGSAMTVRGIEDAMIVVIGTDECSYYTKHMTLHSEEFGGVFGRCVSVVLDSRDVTFGSKKKIEEAMKELVEEYEPKAVFLTTTCVVEIIGDDMDTIAEALTEEYHIPFLSVHTEHFKCENHMPGLERTITACFSLMEPQEKENTVNVLGQRMGSFQTTELCRILKENQVEIGMQLPSGCTIEEIKTAPKAKLNVVVHPIALPLARKMEQKFGTPYVFFHKFTRPENIYEAYEKLFACLEIPMTEELIRLYEKAKDRREEAKEELSGITYIYGNTPFDTMEFNQFMTEEGMEPLVIQLSEYDPKRQEEMVQTITKKVNPYVAKSANIAPMQFIYDVLKPNLYLGHEYAARLRKKGIEIVHTDKASGLLGFEVTFFIIEELVRASKEAKELRKEKGEEEKK